MTDRHRISAGAIVVHESRVLMVRCRKLGAYDFRVCPGGGVKEAETLEAAAAREVMEENGVTAMAAPSSRHSMQHRFFEDIQAGILALVRIPLRGMDFR
jgi:8-oxo-dGTP pyrophosphatase MutT (NUDIX family)